MFQRFTDRARRVVVVSQEESRALRHTYIGPEHLLLAVLADGTPPVAMAVRAVGIDVDSVRARITPGNEQRWTGGHIPFTPVAKSVLEFALRESLELGHDRIEPAHIMLALLRVDGFPLEDLTPPGFTRTALREALLREIRDTWPPSAAAQPVQRILTDPYLHDVDARLNAIRRGKDDAIDARDLETAVRLRVEEVTLLGTRAAAVERLLRSGPPAVTPGRWYICYRAEDAAGVAVRLGDALGRAVGPDNVVMDVTAPPDRDQSAEIMTAAASAQFILVLIGQSWLDSRATAGRRRLELPNDEVRVALLAATGPGQLAVPVLVDGASMPGAEDLPPGLAWLAGREPARLDQATFTADVERLLGRMG